MNRSRGASNSRRRSSSRSRSSSSSSNNSTRHRARDRPKRLLEGQKPYDTDQLKKFSITISGNATCDQDGNRREVLNPQNIKIIRRPGEGSRPIFDREELRQDRRIVRRSSSHSRSESRSPRRRSSSHSSGGGRRSRRRRRRRSRTRGSRSRSPVRTRRPLIDQRYPRRRSSRSRSSSRAICVNEVCHLPQDQYRLVRISPAFPPAPSSRAYLTPAAAAAMPMPRSRVMYMQPRLRVWHPPPHAIRPPPPQRSSASQAGPSGARPEPAA